MKKKAYSEPFTNTRQLVNYLNENGIERDDVLDIVKLDKELFLIYYK